MGMGGRGSCSLLAALPFSRGMTFRGADCERRRVSWSTEPRSDEAADEGPGVGYRGGTGRFASGLRLFDDLLRGGTTTSWMLPFREDLPDWLEPESVIRDSIFCKRPAFFGVRERELSLDGEGAAKGPGGPSARKSMRSLVFVDNPFCFSSSRESFRPALVETSSSE